MGVAGAGIRRSRFWEMTRLGSLYKIVKIFFKRLDFSEIWAGAANYGPPIIPHEKLKVNTFFYENFFVKNFHNFQLDKKNLHFVSEKKE